MTRPGLTAAIFMLCISLGLAAEVTQRTSPEGHQYWHYPIEDEERSAITFNMRSALDALPAGQELAPRMAGDILTNASSFQQIKALSSKEEGAEQSLYFVVRPGDVRLTMETASQNASAFAKIARDVFANPDFSQDAVEEARKRLIANAQRQTTRLGRLARNSGLQIVLGDSKIGKLLATPALENTNTVSSDTLGNWHRKTFTTGAMQITAAGSSDFDLIGKTIDTALTDVPEGNAAQRDRLSEVPILDQTILVHAPGLENSYIYVVGKIPAASDGTDLEMNLSAGVLGFSEQSRLFKNITVGSSAREGFRSGLDTLTREQRLLRLSGEVETALLAEALEAAEEAYEEFRDGGIGIIEFPFARSIYEGRVEASLKKPRRASYLLMESRLNGLPLDDLSTIAERVGDLARGDVNKFVAKTYPAFEEMLKIIVTPDANAIEDACVITLGEGPGKCLN